MRPMPSPAPAAMPAHFDGWLRRLLFAFAVIAVTRGFTDAIAARASFTFATLRDLTFRGTAASLSFQVRSSEVVWISMISLRGLHLFVLPARCHVICRRTRHGMSRPARQKRQSRAEHIVERRVPIARNALLRRHRADGACHRAAAVALTRFGRRALPHPDRRDR